MSATLPILLPRETAIAHVKSGATFERLEPPGNGDLVAALLADQANLTAVDRFSTFHDSVSGHAGNCGRTAERSYSALLPASSPGPGEQYAFEVDLDLCSGCKACVTACHQLNGLDEGEAWRDVGLLHGGTAAQPVVQHVTTACHHCLEPACAVACPVDAYEKDAATGIVRHLDDQCFGCQYCTLACPYDVPKYHKAKGIVRKCDMCRDRLAEGESPACAQACPHGAIRITLVDSARVVEDCEANSFLPGAPDPDYTLPTTTFKTVRSLPRNLLPADYYDVKPEHAHWPLVAMLVLTQLSVGGFVTELGLNLVAEQRSTSSLHPAFSLAWGLLALGASTLHLGRPWLAWRAVIGLRHSWLSREAVAFAAFAPLAALYAGLSWLEPDWYRSRPILQHALAAAVALAGLAGIGCGVLVYHVVRRPFWHAGRSGTKFLGTAALLGLSATLLTIHANALVGVDGGVSAVHFAAGRGLCLAIASVAAFKLLVEAAHFAHLRDARFTAFRRTALLMAGPLANMTAARFVLGVTGGLILPALLSTADEDTSAALIVFGSTLSFLTLLAGELAERYLFFTAVVRQKMPGGLAV